MASGAGLLAPAPASPRVTLELRGTELHETLRRLSEFYGRRLVGPRGEGTDAYAEAAGAAPASFAWKDATLGTVLRDVGRAYRLTPRMEKGGDVRFLAGAAPAGGRTLRGEQLSVTLRRVDQQETRTHVSGVSQPQVERSIALHLTLRTHDADAGRIHSLPRAHAVDDRGRKWELLSVPQSPDGPPAEPDLPDERSMLLRATGLPAGVRRLAKVEGTVLLYRSLATHRIEVRPGSQEPPALQSAGPLRFRSTLFSFGEGRITCSATVGWPEGVDLLLPEKGEAAPPFCRARLAGGRLVPLEARVQPIAGVDSLPHGARLTVPSASLPGAPVAVLWDLTAGFQPDLEVPFTFSPVELPLEGARAAIPAPGTSSLLIRPSASISQQEGELSVGLSRREAAGWGPTRWRTLDVAPGVPARVEGLAPGSYRLALRFRRRGPDGKLQPAIPLQSGLSKPVQLTPNRETPYPVAP